MTTDHSESKPLASSSSTPSARPALKRRRINNDDQSFLNAHQGVVRDGKSIVIDSDDDGKEEEEVDDQGTEIVVLDQDDSNDFTPPLPSPPPPPAGRHPTVSKTSSGPSTHGQLSNGISSTGAETDHQEGSIRKFFIPLGRRDSKPTPEHRSPVVTPMRTMTHHIPRQDRGREFKTIPKLKEHLVEEWRALGRLHAAGTAVGKKELH